MEDDIQYKSKTQRKKEAHALQDLGVKLAELPLQELERLDIPGDLKKALLEGRSITSNVAARRHRQYIGALMRDVDPDLIRSALSRTGGPAAESRENNAVEARMERLLSNEAAELESLLEECPGLERQRLRQLIRNVRKEKPGTSPSKSRKTLIQLLKTHLHPS